MTLKYDNREMKTHKNLNSTKQNCLIYNLHTAKGTAKSTGA